MMMVMMPVMEVQRTHRSFRLALVVPEVNRRPKNGDSRLLATADEDVSKTNLFIDETAGVP
jgi:hypothetical protein